MRSSELLAATCMDKLGKIADVVAERLLKGHHGRATSRQQLPLFMTISTASDHTEMSTQSERSTGENSWRLT